MDGWTYSVCWLNCLLLFRGLLIEERDPAGTILLEPCDLNDCLLRQIEPLVLSCTYSAVAEEGEVQVSMGDLDLPTCLAWDGGAGLDLCCTEGLIPPLPSC